MTRDNGNGGREVTLYIPFELGEEKITSVTFEPFKLDHKLKWYEGNWKSIIAMLAELSSLKTEERVRELRYPDADRVLAAFMDLLPPELAADVAAGKRPMLAEEQASPAEEPVTQEQLDALAGGDNVEPDTDAGGGIGMDLERAAA